MLPPVAPSRSECQRQMLDALRAEGCRLYVDASVLRHCYEISRSACEELLVALDGLGARIRVPIWAAKETWDHTRELPAKHPLKKLAGGLTSQLGKFRSESMRYVDERTFDDISMEDFSTELDRFVAAGEQLSKRAEKIEPGHDDANARLLPFITNHSLSSDMAAIYDEVHRTGELRYAHDVPPGFADGGAKVTGLDESQDDATVSKGKKRNRFGDLIFWLEALQDCAAPGATELMILTRDNSKKDWVYRPERVTGDDGGLQQNGGLITLPLPLLAKEAKHRCPGLNGVHVVSLEMMTLLLRTGFGARVGNLVRALQPAVAPTRPARGQRPPDRQEGEEAPATVTFGSKDMMFEPEADADDAIWKAVAGLRSDGWTMQNDAAVALAELIPGADPDEAKQIGRALAAAANADAVGPLELAQEVFREQSASIDVRANLLAGMLGETYFDENGEPRKPMAETEMTELLFANAVDDDMRPAYEAVGVALGPIKRLYLALPGESAREIRLELQLNGNTLVGVQADGRELLEANAASSRQIAPGGRNEEMPVAQLKAEVAREFVVPEDMLVLEGPTNFQVVLPERIGFVDWGPDSGEELR